MNMLERLLTQAATLHDLTQKLSDQMDEAATENRGIDAYTILHGMTGMQAMLTGLLATTIAQVDRLHRGLPILDADTGLAVVPPTDDGPAAA